jgi:hypothetical protein
VVISACHDPVAESVSVDSRTEGLAATMLDSHSTTWRTRSGGMEVSKAQSIVGQFVKIRCSNLAAKAAQVAEAQIISHNDKEVGPFGHIVGFIGRL